MLPCSFAGKSFQPVGCDPRKLAELLDATAFPFTRGSVDAATVRGRS